MFRKFRFISICIALLLVLAFVSVVSAAVNRVDRPALKEVYKDYFLIGNVFGNAGGITGITPGDNSENALRLKHFNAMTPGNFSKPDSIWNQTTGRFSFTGADPGVREGRNLGYYTIGHALVWHNQSTNWPAANNSWNYLQAKEQMEFYIKSVVEHFVGDVKFDAWDVVNEVMKDNPANPTDWRNALRTGYNPMERPSRWARAYAKGGNSWDYVYDAFYFARKYTDAKLIFNDFNDLENDAKATAIASLVKELNERYAAEHPEDPRKLIEVIGVQAHYDTRLNLDALDRNIKKYLDLGVEVHITEMDISLNIATGKYVSATNTGRISNRAELETLFKEQAIFYAKLFMLFKEYAHYNAGIPRISWFTIYDQNGWRSMSFPMIWESVGQPAVMQPKEAYWAVIQPEEYLIEADMTPGGPATFTYGGKSYTARTWGGAHSFAEIGVSVPAVTRTIDFTAENNVTLPVGFSISGIEFNPANGAVGGGKPCVVTVKAVSETNPDNTAAYKLTFALDEDCTKTEKAWRLAKSIESGKTYIIVSTETDMALTNKSKLATTGALASPVSLARSTVIVSGDILVFGDVEYQGVVVDSMEQENLKFIFQERTSPAPGPYTQKGHTIQCLVHATNAYPGIVFRGTAATNNQYELISRQQSGNEGPLVADKALDQAVWFNTDIDPDTGETQMFLYSG
ncbi:MAG: endo-1,4-beta-xylanase, partial [Oscillospiraceae bacterium]|nr:endo-1,4-beta-xylanase [Oscillospiraceae bacterium]